MATACFAIDRISLSGCLRAICSIQPRLPTLVLLGRSASNTRSAVAWPAQRKSARDAVRCVLRDAEQRLFLGAQSRREAEERAAALLDFLG
jgi:hypothetical protein